MAKWPHPGEEHIADQATYHRRQPHEGTVDDDQYIFSSAVTDAEQKAQRYADEQGNNGAGQAHPQSYSYDIEQLFIAGQDQRNGFKKRCFHDTGLLCQCK